MAEIDTRAESNAVQAAYDVWCAAEDNSETDSSSERRALVAGWLAGREWARGYAAGVIMGQRFSQADTDDLFVRMLDRAIYLGERAGASSYQRGMAEGIHAGKELTGG